MKENKTPEEDQNGELCSCCGTNDNCDWVKSGEEECCICANLPYEDWCNGCKEYNPRVYSWDWEIEEVGVKFKHKGYNKEIYIDGFEHCGKSWHVWGRCRTFKGVHFDSWQIWIPISISMLLWNSSWNKNQIVVPNWFYEKSMKVYYRKKEKW